MVEFQSRVDHVLTFGSFRQQFIQLSFVSIIFSFKRISLAFLKHCSEHYFPAKYVIILHFKKKLKR